MMLFDNTLLIILYDQYATQINKFYIMSKFKQMVLSLLRYFNSLSYFPNRIFQHTHLYQ